MAIDRHVVRFLFKVFFFRTISKWQTLHNWWFWAATLWNIKHACPTNQMSKPHFYNKQIPTSFGFVSSAPTEDQGLFKEKIRWDASAEREDIVGVSWTPAEAKAGCHSPDAAFVMASDSHPPSILAVSFWTSQVMTRPFIPTPAILHNSITDLQRNATSSTGCRSEFMPQFQNCAPPTGRIAPRPNRVRTVPVKVSSLPVNRDHHASDKVQAWQRGMTCLPTSSNWLRLTSNVKNDAWSTLLLFVLIYECHLGWCPMVTNSLIPRHHGLMPCQRRTQCLDWQRALLYGAAKHQPAGSKCFGEAPFKWAVKSIRKKQANYKRHNLKSQRWTKTTTFHDISI